MWGAHTRTYGPRTKLHSPRGHCYAGVGILLWRWYTTMEGAATDLEFRAPGFIFREPSLPLVT